MDQKQTLEKFILNNKELEKLESLVAQFNVFETLNIVNAEIRHSSVLAWLLNPNANHGCGDYFVKLVLKYIFSKNRDSLKSNLTIFDLENFDYSDLEIRREWNNIDILIISEKNKFIVTIENKIISSEHSNQLERYFKIIEKNFPNFEKIFVYLTPEGEIGSDENWLILDYSVILNALNDLIEYKRSSASEKILSFLKQYSTIIRRYIVSNSEIEQICRNIYKKHQQALDIIFQYKPDIEYEVSKIVKNIISSKPELILDSAGKTVIRFTTKELDSIMPKKGSGWTSSGRILMFEFSNCDKRLVLRLYIGPGPADIREKLHEIALKNTSLFNKSKRQLGRKHLAIYQSEYLKKTNYEEADEEELKARIDKKFNNFLIDDLKKIEAFFKENWKNH